MTKIGIIIQARIGSTRLPGKVLRPLNQYTVLDWVVQRCLTVKRKDAVIVATTENHQDDQIVELCKKSGYLVYRGSEDDVLTRYRRCAEAHAIDIIVRITSDCPFIPPEIVDESINVFQTTDCSFVNNSRLEFTFPQGLDIEVFSFKTLVDIDPLAIHPYEREHVTIYIYEHPQDFKIHSIRARPEYFAPTQRLSIDTEEDYRLAADLAVRFSQYGVLVDTKEIIAFLKSAPEIAAINRHVKQKPISRTTVRKSKVLD